MSILKIFKSFDFGIRLLPQNIEPPTGKLGQVYFNNNFNNLRICIDESLNRWYNVFLEPAITSGSTIYWDNSNFKYFYNDKILILNNNLVGNNNDLILSTSDSSTQPIGLDIILQPGLGTTSRGRVLTTANVIQKIISENKDLIVAAADTSIPNDLGGTLTLSAGRNTTIISQNEKFTINCIGDTNYNLSNTYFRLSSLSQIYYIWFDNQLPTNLYDISITILGSHIDHETYFMFIYNGQKYVVFFYNMFTIGPPSSGYINDLLSNFGITIDQLLLLTYDDGGGLFDYILDVLSELKDQLDTLFISEPTYNSILDSNNLQLLFSYQSLVPSTTEFISNPNDLAGFNFSLIAPMSQSPSINPNDIAIAVPFNKNDSSNNIALSLYNSLSQNAEFTNDFDFTLNNDIIQCEVKLNGQTLVGQNNINVPNPFNIVVTQNGLIAEPNIGNVQIDANTVIFNSSKFVISTLNEDPPNQNNLIYYNDKHKWFKKFDNFQNKYIWLNDNDVSNNILIVERIYFNEYNTLPQTVNDINPLYPLINMKYYIFTELTGNDVSYNNKIIRVEYINNTIVYNVYEYYKFSSDSPNNGGIIYSLFHKNFYYYNGNKYVIIYNDLLNNFVNYINTNISFVNNVIYDIDTNTILSNVVNIFSGNSLNTQNINNIILLPSQILYYDLSNNSFIVSDISLYIPNVSFVPLLYNDNNTIIPLCHANIYYQKLLTNQDNTTFYTLSLNGISFVSLKLNYSLYRDNNLETGTLYVISNTLQSNHAGTSVNLSPIGIIFNTDIDNNTLLVRAFVDNSDSNNGVIVFSIERTIK